MPNDITLTPEVQREAEAVAAQLLERFPGACLAGGGEEAIVWRLGLIAELGHDEVVAGLELLYPDEVRAAADAGLDPVTSEAMLWAAADADRRMMERVGRQEVDRIRQGRASASKASRRRQQAKASRKANRRR